MTATAAFSVRRALGVAALTAAAGAAALTAQSTPTPTPAPLVTVGGVVYTQYVYQLQDTANHNNGFDIKRAYINVIGRFSGGVYTRVTGDVFTNADSSRAYRLKYAYAAWTPNHSSLTYKIGLIHTPWLDWEEALWDYRMQGPMAMDRNGYVSAADFGAGIDGKWGPDKVNVQLAAANGENYNKGVGDQRKDLMGRVSVRLRHTNDSSRVGGLRVTAYGQYGKPTTGGARQRWLAMISYRSKVLTLAAEAAATRDSANGPPATKPTNGHVYSAFGVYKVPKSKLALLARLDLTHAQATVLDNRTRFIGGVSYQLSPNWRLLADWDVLGYQTAPTPLDPNRSQALFQTQFTF